MIRPIEAAMLVDAVCNRNALGVGLAIVCIGIRVWKGCFT